MMKIIVCLIFGLVSSLGCQSLQRAPANVTSDLKKFESVVRAFENSGGKGKWIEVSSPFDLENYATKRYYQILSVPSEVDLKSPFYLMRLENSRQLVEAMIQKKVTLILGMISLETNIFAMTFPQSDPFSVTALQALGVSQLSSVILIQAATDKYSLVHEYRHWQDQQSPHYIQGLIDIFNPYFKKDLISKEGFNAIYLTVSEIRGYSAQIKELSQDRGSHLPFVTTSGKIISAEDPKLGATYLAEESDAENRFLEGPYRQDFFDATAKIRKYKRQFQTLMGQLEKFDGSEDSSSPLTFKKLSLTQ